jgi:hypothetical protein
MICLAAIALVAVGCGGGPKRPPTFAAKGTIKQKGQPVAGALVVFHPLDKGRENDAKPVATTKDDGSFALTTFDEGDGAPAGEYGVTVVWNEQPKAGKMSLSGEGGSGTDRLGGRYGDPRSPKLKANVKADGTNDFAFEVP